MLRLPEIAKEVGDQSDHHQQYLLCERNLLNLRGNQEK